MARLLAILALTIVGLNFFSQVADAQNSCTGLSLNVCTVGSYFTSGASCANGTSPGTSPCFLLSTEIIIIN
jgi:hypothetical protein